jgi:hypothetical protein
VPRARLRRRDAVVDRVETLGVSLRRALGRQAAGAADRETVDALWGAEGLGTLLWSFGLTDAADFDQTFDAAALLTLEVGAAELLDPGEIARARASARLWHWRARTALLGPEAGAELSERWQSINELVALAALRGHQRGLLPAPIDDDFPAFGAGYALLAPAQRSLLLSIAYERHRALNWLSGLGRSWEDTPTDT